MPKIFNFKLRTLAAAIILLSTHSAYASDFNLPFISASGLGNTYADWATNTDDASNVFSNPAGMTALHHQQLVIAPLGIIGSTKFTGTTVSPAPFPLVETGSASSRIGAFIPSVYYSYPINNRWAIGISSTVPFALGTNYQKDSIVRYLNTRSTIVVMDIGPSVAYQVNDRWSLGLGLDFNRLTFTLNNMVRAFVPGLPDSESQNHLTGYGVGWHGGVLYNMFPRTRVGFSFNSMVALRSTGDSELFTPSPPSQARTTNQKANARLPARAQLSIHHDLTDRVAIMGTVFYTNWETFNQLTLKRVVISPTGATTSVTIPFEYHNTFDYSLGMNFKATDKWLLRIGVQILNAPSNNRDRGVADPVGTAEVLGVGAHYQQNAKLGYDFGVAHSFFHDMTVGATTPLIAASGFNSTQTTVLGAQVNWNIS